MSNHLAACPANKKGHIFTLSSFMATGVFQCTECKTRFDRFGNSLDPEAFLQEEIVFSSDVVNLTFDGLHLKLNPAYTGPTFSPFGS